MLFLLVLSLAFVPVEPLMLHVYAKDLAEHYDGSSVPNLSSDKALVVNQNTGVVKYAKNSSIATPIASITKLMTAMVVLDARQSFDETINISQQDVDTIKNTRSRLTVGTKLSRGDMFKLALMSSENRAAFSLARHYPGGQAAFVKAMNTKALILGLVHTHFVEPTGLMYQNTSTAEDLYSLVAAAYQYPEIRNATTTASYQISINGRRKPLEFKNTNKLVREGDWDIGLSKTGYINEAGRCLVMQTTVEGEPLIVVFLDAAGSNKRIGDANRIRKWIEYNHANAIVADGGNYQRRANIN
ncbi:MAG: D-alanyl-D-alanine endopeptidase [Methylophilaceae bacterium]|jgi:serine-type D-Ala-D-Ala endopeptidase (penicillin-binding protein 7)|nr:D-alanyl-D-alanine endopeptidase [Methylophilaceae bacterium]MDG1820466.1 D-alanyl-D-alanine endopeptidase [Methylophilaceae bacterium]